MSFNKADKSFKATINKKFTTPNRTLYQEESGKTLNIHKTDVWADTISSVPATAIANGIAELFTQQVLTPDPIYNANVFHFMIDSGAFVAGVDSYSVGIANNAQRTDFISEKYGNSYKTLLYDNSGNLIGETDSIGWFFDYVTGVLHIDSPALYSTPYKITTYRYTGSTISSTGGVAKKLNRTDRNLTASATSTNGDLACSTAISNTPLLNSGVRVYLNNARVECGNTANDYCYFSNDGGTTKKIFGQESQNDLLYWNGSIATYELEVDDFITFDYLEN